MTSHHYHCKTCDIVSLTTFFKNNIRRFFFTGIIMCGAATITLTSSCSTNWEVARPLSSNYGLHKTVTKCAQKFSYSSRKQQPTAFLSLQPKLVPIVPPLNHTSFNMCNDFHHKNYNSNTDGQEHVICTNLRVSVAGHSRVSCRHCGLRRSDSYGLRKPKFECEYYDLPIYQLHLTRGKR
jgi:hypothetical protein